MKDEILHNAEKYQSKLARRRDKPVKFIWVFLAMMTSGIAGVASAHQLTVTSYFIAAIFCGISVSIIDSMRKKLNRYYEMLNSISMGMYTTRYAKDFAERTLWRDRRDMMDYDLVCQELERRHDKESVQQDNRKKIAERHNAKEKK
jgi:hypothetical protein